MAVQAGMRVLVTGASGLLGRALVHAASHRGCSVLAVSRQRLQDQPTGVVACRVDQAESGAIEQLVTEHQPDAVVHTAAITDVDWCEAHPAEAERVNAVLPGEIAAAAHHAGAMCVYISTDGVFDGERGSYSEDDVPRPLNVYARCKLQGEEHVRTAHPDALVVRTNLFGGHPLKRGLAEWMLGRLAGGQKVPAFADVVFSPLYARDLADIVLDMAAASLDGVFHLAARDACSKFEFGRELAEAFGYELSLVERAALSDASLHARRPRNTTLDVSRVSKALSRAMPTVRDGIDHFRRSRP